MFNCLLSRYHYLGHRNTVGEKSGIWCAMSWIEWDSGARKANLALLTNNTRFLVLPWVEVPHLASHMLAIITRRLCGDGLSKPGYPVHAQETFVDRSRFRGTCYQATNLSS